MSVAAVLLVKDEVDLIGDVITHLEGQVDEIIVQDNLSTDGTKEILEGRNVTLVNDREVGYWQSRKTTALAARALSRGHQWVIPCDADEVWYAPDGRPLNEYLGGMGPDVQIVSAQLFNHIPTVRDDPADPWVFRRIGWRKRDHAPMGKVACRLHPALIIHAGNHSAELPGVCLQVGGLVIRHFSWRTPEQYLRKIRNGERAYRATRLPETTGAHWRMFENATDEAVMDHFRQWFFSGNPEADDTMIYDPAPIGG